MAVTNTLTDTISISYTGNGKSVSSKLGTFNGSKDAGIGNVIPAGSTNLLVTVAFPYANIQAIVFDASQNLTILTNSTSSPGNTIALNANYGVFWGVGFLAAKPLTADVTAFYITNSGATDAQFNFRVLYN
jgi:hypothetical protein